MRSGKEVIYWDTCSFIAWMKYAADEPEGQDEEILAALDEVATKVHANRAILVTAVVTRTEILDGKNSPEAIAKIDNLFKRRNVQEVVVDQRVARLAQEIRSYHAQRGEKLSVTDSWHLAAAVLYEADEFHTLDGSGKKPRKSDVLKLSQPIGSKYNLKVVCPRVKPGHTRQTALFKGESSDESKGKPRD